MKQAISMIFVWLGPLRPLPYAGPINGDIRTGVEVFRDPEAPCAPRPCLTLDVSESYFPAGLGAGAVCPMSLPAQGMKCCMLERSS